MDTLTMMTTREHANMCARRRAALDAWEALPASARTPLRAMAVCVAHGFTCGFPHVGERNWVLGSWETLGPDTYGHPCLTLSGRIS